MGMGPEEDQIEEEVITPEAEEVDVSMEPVEPIGSKPAKKVRTKKIKKKTVVPQEKPSARSEEAKARKYKLETSNVSKNLGFQDPRQSASYEDLYSFADKFNIPKAMRDAIVGQIYNESSFYRDKYGDASQAHGFLQFKGSRLGEFIRNYYSDNPEMMKIVNQRIKPNGTYDWKSLSPIESKIISEQFESDPKNEEKTLRYVFGELNPTGNLEKYGVKSISTERSGLKKEAFVEFNRLMKKKDKATLDEWSEFFTKHYVKPSGREQESVIRGRVEQAKKILDARSRRSEESNFGFSNFFKRKSEEKK